MKYDKNFASLVVPQNDNPEIELSFLDIANNAKRIARYRYFEKNLLHYIKDNEFRDPAVGNNYKNEKIIVAGDSFVWGDNLKLKDTFGGVLVQFFPKYKVYNMSLTGGSPKETLYVLRNYKKYQNQDILPPITKKNDVKYYIYVGIYDQKTVLYLKHRFRIPSPLYKVEKSNNGEKELKYYESANPIYRTFTYKFFVQSYVPYKMFDKYSKDLFTLYMQEIKKEVDKIYPNTKFVLFVYSDLHENNKFDLQAIENLGIKVIELDKISKIDFSQEKYRTFFHPTVDAWQEIVPLLGKELNL